MQRLKQNNKRTAAGEKRFPPNFHNPQFAGDEAFYLAPSPLPAGEPAMVVIRTADLLNAASLASVARNILVLRLSRNINVRDIAVFGTIAFSRAPPVSGCESGC